MLLSVSNVVGTLILLITCFYMPRVVGLADITIYSAKTHEQIDAGYVAAVTRYGPPVPNEGFLGMVVYSNPAQACSEIDGPPPIHNPTNQWIVLIMRGNCTFESKVRNAQQSNYNFAIVHNTNSQIEPMYFANRTGINISSILVNLEVGMKFKQDYQYYNNVYVIIEDDSNFPFDINADLLVPFAVVVAICSLTMISFMICKCIRDRRRERRHRLPTSSLRKIPIEKFTKGSTFEMCAICLDDYIEGEKLRILPCSHAYHTKCIDPWLTRNRRVCPICKRKVFAADETPFDASDTDSDTENERTPLVRQEPVTQQPLSGRPPYVLSRERILSHLRIARASRRAQRSISSDSGSSNGRGVGGGGSGSGSGISTCNSSIISGLDIEGIPPRRFPGRPAHVMRSINSFEDDLSASTSGSISSYRSTGHAPSINSQTPYNSAPTAESSSSTTTSADVVNV